MIFLSTVLLLAASVAGRPAEVYTVHRQDYVSPQRTTPTPYQAYSSQDGIYRVDRQEYGKAYQPFASTTNFRTLPRTDYGQNQYWYPSTVSYDHSEYQPNGVLSPPFSYNTPLFVPTPNQVFRSSNPVWTVLRPPPPPTTPQTIFHPTTASTFEDDNVLPAIPKSSVYEGEPLTALEDHSKKTLSSRPTKYVPIDDDVEINIEQRDMLMNTYHSPTKPIDKTEETVFKRQSTPRVRRDLYSSYPISFGEQIDTRPLRPRMFYQLYLDEDFAKNVRTRDEFEDIPSTSANLAPQYPTVIENNEIADIVSDETYAAYRPVYDAEDLPPVLKDFIPRHPADANQYGISDEVVVVWKPSVEPIASTSETPTTNADYYEYVDLDEEKTSEASPIACLYSAETETEIVTSATPEIVTTETPEWSTIDGEIVGESILSNREDIRALFGASKRDAESPADDVDYDYEQVVTPNDTVENDPLPTNDSCLPCEDQVLKLNIADRADLSELSALKELIRALSSAPEIQIEFSEEDVNAVDVQIDDLIFSAIGEEPALYATLGSHPELSDELLKAIESMTAQIDDDTVSSSTTAETPTKIMECECDDESTDVTPTTETVTETTTTDFGAADEEKYSTPKVKTELSLREAFDLALVRGMLPLPPSSSEEETSSPVPVTEDVNAEDLSSGETLMFDIVRQEPKVSLAFDGSRRK